LSVTVKTLAGDSFDVDALNRSTTIAQLKLQLRDPARSGALVSHQELFLPDCEDALANHSTLDACGVVGGTVLFLVVSGDAVGADGLFQQMALVDVTRDGVACRVDRASLVPGDLVKMNCGDQIPADMYILDDCSSDFTVDCSCLTGEGEPERKRHDPSGSTESCFLAARNIALSHCYVATGQSSGLVLATGISTVIGKVSSLLVAEKERKFNSTQVRAALRLLDEHNVLLSSPAVLDDGPGAVAVQRNADRRRHRGAPEPSVPEWCVVFGKSGSLTSGSLSVEQLFLSGDTHPADASSAALGRPVPRNSALARLVQAAALVPSAGVLGPAGERASGSNLALSKWSQSHAGAQKHLFRLASGGSKWPPEVAAMPFSGRDKFEATIRMLPGEESPVAFMMGSTDRVLANCAFLLEKNGNEAPLSESRLSTIGQAVTSLSENGMLVRAFAMKRLPSFGGPPGRSFGDDPFALCRQALTGTANDGTDNRQSMVFIGFIGICYGERPEAAGVVARLRQRGFQVAVTTQDHKSVAAAVARRVGVLTGSHDPALVQHGSAAFVRHSEVVLAGQSPGDKAAFIRALQQSGRKVLFVGVTSSDCAAGRRADLFVVMGRTGHAVNKEIAGAILMDDDLRGIPLLLEELYAAAGVELPPACVVSNVGNSEAQASELQV
jgi:magnesium-transporting ATPase (P-type)